MLSNYSTTAEKPRIFSHGIKGNCQRGFMSRFQIKPAKFKKNTGYAELSLTPFTGNDRDWFKHPVLERSCGDKMDCGALFAYLFRRFGNPNGGWDDYKELARYYLSTTLKDMLLSVVPYAGNSASIHFRFMVTHEVSAMLDGYDGREFHDYFDRLLSWIESNNLLPDWMDEFLKVCSEEVCPVSNWRQAFKYLPMFKFDDDPANFKRFSSWHDEIVAKYNEIETRPPSCKVRSLDWEEWSDDDPLKKYYRAAFQTLEDLKRPTYVRDIYINAYGRVADKDLRKLKTPAGYAASAGYPSGDLGNDAPKEFGELHELILKLGKGNAKRGIQDVLGLLAPIIKAKKVRK